MVICLDRQERVHATEKKYADVTLGAVKSLCESFVRLAFRLRILDTSLITVFPMHTKLFLALLALALPLSALPPDAESLKSNRDAAITKINATYGIELTKLQKKYMAAGNLAAANEIEKEIGKATPEPLASNEPKLDGKWLVNGKMVRSFSGKTMVDHVGKPHPWTLRGENVIIDWGKGSETLKLDSKNPDTLISVNGDGGVVIYKRL